MSIPERVKLLGNERSRPDQEVLWILASDFKKQKSLSKINLGRFFLEFFWWFPQHLRSDNDIQEYFSKQFGKSK
mgnify:CR=1 FL=1